MMRHGSAMVLALAVTAAASDAQSPTAHAINVRGGERDFVTQRLADQVTLQDGMTGSLFDEDGSAIVIHAGPDAYASQPSGAAGDRTACGVVQR